MELEELLKDLVETQKRLMNLAEKIYELKKAQLEREKARDLDFEQKRAIKTLAEVIDDDGSAGGEEERMAGGESESVGSEQEGDGENVSPACE